jgi:enamidase
MKSCAAAQKTADGDPVSDVMALQRMPYVFKAGVGYRTQAIFDALRGKVGLY